MHLFPRLALLIALAATILGGGADDFPVLAGPYLGQKPPGDKAEIFAPGIISTGGIEYTPAFTPEQHECFYTIFLPEKRHAILSLTLEGNSWQRPVPAFFSGGDDDADLTLSPDGNKAFFWSNRPLPTGEKKSDADLWMSEKRLGTWGPARWLGTAVNNSDWQIGPTISSDGSLYFASYRHFSTAYRENFGKMDLYRSELVDGVYGEPVNLGISVNTASQEKEPFVFPDESYILFASDRPGGFGDSDLYVSFRKADGSWTEPMNLGESINSSKWEGVPIVSPDGKYLFFSSDRSGNSDVYWVSAGVIERLRPKETKPDDFPVLTGPYLGQKPPGDTPEIFAPGIISRGYFERSVVFSPSQDELYFQLRVLGFTSVLLSMKQIKGRWTEPETALFSGIPEYLDDGPFFAPDGRRLFFTSTRPLAGKDGVKKDSDIWILSKTNSQWGRPLPAGSPLNSDFDDDYPTLSASNNVYFCSNRDGNYDLYMSTTSEKGFSEPQRLGSPVNTENYEGHPFIAADESYLIFSSDRPGQLGEADLYISFKRKDGQWLEPINMGNKINTPFHEVAPYVSPDGHYLFFCSFRPDSPSREMRRLTLREIRELLDGPGNGYGDVYWVSTKIIDDLRPNSGRISGL